MKLLQFRTLWGVIDECDGESARSPAKALEETVLLLKRLGFDGIELPYKLFLHLGVERVAKLLKEQQMKINLMIMTDNVLCPGTGILWGGPHARPLGGDVVYSTPAQPGDSVKLSGEELVSKHVAVFREQVEDISKLAMHPEIALPVHIVNSHSGRDFFSQQMAETFFSEALAIERHCGYNQPLAGEEEKVYPRLQLCHETHRSRILYSPWLTRDLMKRVPGIRLCADFSHWVCTAESMDADLCAAIHEVCPFVIHTHCRVGHEQGSQVPDPRTEEWSGHVSSHEVWWDAIWQVQKARGDATSCLIAEHGPPPYQPCQPGPTREPLAKIWEVNHWVHARRQKRFRELFPADDCSSLVEEELLRVGWSPQKDVKTDTKTVSEMAKAA
ncbi:unnamed protein product [Amoebophrya sp. A25]|nr:unnamed protein product [Amoebophrya sp. A25]|eukprot:GSA25T00011574001.1